MKAHRSNKTRDVHFSRQLLKDAVLIAERKEQFSTVELYQSGAFYIEVFRHNHFNVIVKVNSFTDTRHLEPYLQHIAIDSILPE